MIALYARVSSNDQNTAMQVEDLIKFAINSKEDYKIFQDSDTGSVDDRPELNQLMADARAKRFNKLVVWKLDRFFRSTRHLLNYVHELQSLGIEFASVNDNIDTSTPMGRFQLAVMGAIAELELAHIKVRQAKGIEMAKKKGVYRGKKITTDHQKIINLRNAGVSIDQARRQVGCSRSTVIRVFNSEKEKVQKLAQISE